tara:strand:- start:20 stop:412 length:393 start_codon:yes stop_codon:yes gene_type:complete
MDAFQKIVLVVATIILITLLIIVGMLLSKDNKNKNFPPNALVCPDYWKEVGENECQSTGTNKGEWTDNADTKIYFGSDSNSSGVTKYDDENYTNNEKSNITLTGTETCKKKKWANHWNIKWDGITNYNSC